jgi:dipeptidase E
MHWINKSGLINYLSKLLENKVYVGLSAGSMVACKDLMLSTSQKVYEEDLDQTENMAGLNYVNFYFLPHLNSPYFPKVREENYIREVTKDVKEKIYVMDDNSAIKIDDGEIEVISEGK